MEAVIFFLIWWAWNDDIRAWIVETYAQAVEKAEQRKMEVYDEMLDEACCDGCGQDCLSECDECDGCHGCEGCNDPVPPPNLRLTK